MSATTMAQCKLRSDRLSSSPEGKNLEVILDARLNTSTFTEHCPTLLQVCQTTYCTVRSTMASTSREVTNCPSLPGTSETAPKILDRVLGPRFQEDVEKLKRAQKATTKSVRVQSTFLGREVEGVGLVLSGREEVKGCCSFGSLQSFKEIYKDDHSKLFSGVTDQKRGNSQKLQDSI